jgi:hypothetical protein
MQLKFVADAVHNVKFNPVPESSYGIVECILPNIILNIPPLIFILLKVNSIIICLYYVVIIFLISGLLFHTQSGEGFVKRTKRRKKEILEYAKHNDI